MLLTGPLGFIGAAAALLVLQRPFGFVAQLGVIALVGMIIRNSVILVDQIERDEKRGVDTWTAIVEAAVRCCRGLSLRLGGHPPAVHGPVATTHLSVARNSDSRG